jgi:polyphosphate kinase
VALEKPTEREQRDWYLQRYISHLPAAGEIVMFDRSWYNRAGVEAVMGFCRPDEVSQFLREAPEFERMLAKDGIILVKLWFSVSRTEQLSRFVGRQVDPVKRWKLSPTDLASLEAMRYVLSRVVYEDKDEQVVGLPDPLIVGPAPPPSTNGER